MAPAAASTGTGVYVACGYGSEAAVRAHTTCVSLSDALSEAESAGGAATIDLLPGNYCPISLPDSVQKMTLEGAGIAALSGGSLSGYEAELTTFTYEAAYCTGSPPESEIDLSNGYTGDFTLENVAIDPPADGPADGIRAIDADLNLRDDLIENASDIGVYSLSGDDNGLEAVNTAFTGNAVGAEGLGYAFFGNSTFADNTDAALDVVNGDITLVNDTIAENTEGVDIAGDANDVVAANTIVAGNQASSTAPFEDCVGTVGIGGDWEEGGTEAANGYNLIGSTCDVDNPTDIAYDGGGLAEPGPNGGPTPTIAPPIQAEGAAERSLCSDSDQREYYIAVSTACDIGAMYSEGIGTPDPVPSATSLPFSTVDQGLSSTLGVTVSNSGGDLVGVASVSVSGNGFSLTYDGCTYELLIRGIESSYCSVSVTVTPTTSGPLSGLLSIDTTGGEVDVTLSATGGPQAADPGSPAAVVAKPHSGRVALRWTAPVNDGNTPIVGYDVRYSPASSSTWTDGPSSTTTSVSVTGLTNYVTYVFEVRAVNAFGSGNWSAPSAPVTPYAPGDATAFAKATSPTIDAGSSIAVSTTLTDSKSGKPVSGATVSLWSRPGSSGPFSEIGTATTSSSGAVSLTESPRSDTRYEWQFVGSSGHDPATSGIETVLVAQVVRISVTEASVRAGATTDLFGTVSPSETGQTVVLEELSASSGKWGFPGEKATISRQVLPNGKTEAGYVIRFSTKKAGTYSLRVERPATATNAAGTSKTVKVTVS